MDEVRELLTKAWDAALKQGLKIEAVDFITTETYCDSQHLIEMKIVSRAKKSRD